MGRVGERIPSSGFLADLGAFDSSLKIRWDRRDECWVVFQQVRRRELVGEWRGARLSEVKSVDMPVLWVSDFTGEPDRRILEQLWVQRTRDRHERLERAKRRVKMKKQAQRDKTAEKIGRTTESMERGYHEIRKTVSPTVYTS